MKKKISILLALTILIISSNINIVKADTLTENWSKTFNLAEDNVEALYDLANTTLSRKTDAGKRAIEALLAPLGFIVGYITISEQNFHDIFNMKSYGGVDIGGENATNEEVVDDVIDYIINNVSFEGNQITFGGDIKNLLNDYADYVKTTEPWHYMYSYDISQTTDNWTNGIVYNRVRDIIRDHQENNYVFYASDNANINNAKYIFWFIPKNDRYQFVYNTGVTPKQLNMADYYTWEWIWSYQSSSIVSANVYVFDGNTLVPEEVNQQPQIHKCLLQDTPENSSILTNGTYGHLYQYLVSTSGHKDQVIVWDDLNAMKNGSVGNRGYYVSDSYNTNITDSNNVYDSSNSNNITYGDVTNYINNYYGSNGEYPTQPVINIYITNNIPSGSGGSGGGGSGGGGSGDGSDLGIFDFLSRIGQVLGNLIKNLGNVLAELVEGISTTIQALFESIPTVFSDFLGGVLGWLPSELRALVTLAIASMVIVGLIKLFRG